MKKTWLGIVVILVLVIGGAYYRNWHTLHHAAVVCQPTSVVSQSTAVLSPEGVMKEKSTTTSSGWINTLILGADNGETEVSRTDTMMLVSANVDTHKVSIISIPRDIRVNLPGVGLTKINHANVIGAMDGGVHQGTLESAKAVSDLLGVTINYYVKINFQGFQKAVEP